MKTSALIVGLGIALWGCVENGGPATAPPGSMDAGLGCVDLDGDGFGEGCEEGRDCNDADPSIHEGCLRCATPEEGCDCEPGSQPEACFLPKTTTDDGIEMCHEGTRYCRDGTWSGCEGIETYPLPYDSDLSSLVVADAGPVRCNDCNIKCFIIRDNLDAVDGGLDNQNSNGADWASGGGLSITYTDASFKLPDAGGGPVVDGGVISGPSDCVLGTAPDWDCDGIVDTIDPFPFEKPFATANPAIFLDLAPGETGRGVIDLVFFMNTLDIYFLLDQTKSMQSVRTRLRGALINGTFLDSTVECADTDLDGIANNELKSQGVLGGISCLVRNAQFGTGFFRELPFTPYGDDDEILFKHLLDITNDTSAALAAIDTMVTDPDTDWPDADPLALYSLATGFGHYLGLSKPGVPPRVGCPAEKWGYACFRPDAIPVVFLFTDSPMHEGPPSTQNYSYDPANLPIVQGTTQTYVPVPPTNDDFSTAYDAGDVTNTMVSYAGDTSTMATDYGNAFMSCIPSMREGAPDATFTFQVGTTRSIDFITQSTDFTPAVGIYTHAVDTPREQQSDGSNEKWSSSMDLGQVWASWTQVTGSTAGMNSDYSATYVACNAADAAADAVFNFSLSHDARVAISTEGTGYDTVISLHSAAPALPTSVPTTNTNDTVATATNLGDVTGNVWEVTGGDTSAAGLSAAYTGSEIGCGAADTAVDAVHRFVVTEPTRVRLSTGGSSFDNVLALADGALGAQKSTSVLPTNDTQLVAHDMGNLLGGWITATSSSSTLNADYREAFIGCGADTFAADAVYRFTLSASTRMRLETSGSLFDTVISLHNGTIDPTTPLTTDNGNDNADFPTALGNINDKWIEIYAGDTTGMTPDYTQDIIGCGADTASPDAVYQFNVSGTTPVRIDTLGSSFDTVISLHDDVPPRHLTVPIGAVESYDIGSINDGSRIFAGTTAGLVSDYGGTSQGCSTSDTPADAHFDLHVDIPTELVVNTQGSTFDTAIAIFPDPATAPKAPAAIVLDNTNEAKATAVDAGVIDDGWVVYTGDTGTMADDFDDFGCSAFKNARDATFTFTLSTTRTVEISSAESSFDTVLGVFDSASDALIACDRDSAPNETSTIHQTLAAGTYYVVLTGDASNDEGPYRLSIRDEAASNVIACNDNAFATGASQLVVQLVPGDYDVVLKGAAAGAEGAYKIRFTDNDWWAINHRIACDDNSGGGVDSLIQQTLQPGTYYLVVKGDLPPEQGPYLLTVRDLGSTVATTSTIACDNDSGPGTTSFLEANLDAGEYWAVVKGTTGQSGIYDLTFRDVGGAGQGLVLECNAGGPSSTIERDLEPGIYYAFVKGQTAGDAGPYSLRVEDVAAAGDSRIACDRDGGADGVTSYLEQNLTAGDYWVILKSESAAAEGDYTLSVRDMGSSTRTQLACNDSGQFAMTLAPGLYDAVIKGNDNDQLGQYIFTLGGGVASMGTYQPPDWETTLNALQDREMRVITVLNCHDNGDHGDGRDCDFAKQQARDLANATKALGPALSPLVVDIDSNGTGIEDAIMTQLQLLSGSLAMDVSVRVVFEPDPNPGFGLVVTAVDKPGDGCDGLIGLEHQNCRPGATPTFNLDFTNPLDNPVPLNPNDPNGGYNFRADLIADGKYFVDAVPIYIIPQDVNGSTPPPQPAVAATGEYWQDLQSPGCILNERPEWSDLFWTADVPDGTSVAFSVCTTDDPALLDTCVYVPVATVVGGSACATDAECTPGYCGVDGFCKTVTSGVCFDDTQCAAGASCQGGTCLYGGQPVFVGGLLPTENFSYLRMNITLAANLATNAAPTVYDWALTYYCRNVL